VAATVLEPGQDITSFNPYFFWAPKLNPVPDVNAEPYDVESFVERGFRQILDTVNGAQVTCRNPKTPVTGDRLGRVKNLPSGDDGVAIGMQLLFPEMDLLQIISSMNKALQTATSEVVTLTITAGASAAGTVNVVLDGMIVPVFSMAGSLMRPRHTDDSTASRSTIVCPATCQSRPLSWSASIRPSSVSERFLISA
jgi:hypothetical protein